MSKIGDRVGAILGVKDNVIEFLGYGIYEGDFVPKEAIGFFAEARKLIGGTNPRIRLDTGQVVYGCECWWGSERTVKEMLEDYSESEFEIVEVDIDQFRSEYK